MAIERNHIGFFGKMNAGKSSVMNLLTQQVTSIVDSTPGTTADIKIALQEIHGLGPVKLYDSAGWNESGELGEKKKKKGRSALKECDLVMLVINPETDDFSTEQQVLEDARTFDKQILVVYNLFTDTVDRSVEDVKQKLPLLKFYKSIQIHANDVSFRMELLNFILLNYEKNENADELLPFIQPNEFYILNIPMDEETPEGRFLRPQAMCVEYITRKWAHASTYRMDLGKARSEKSEEEKARFLEFLDRFKVRPKVIITDSQAMDVMSLWTPTDIQLTTFSIMMVNHVSRGRIEDFYNGVQAMNTIQDGDKILIAEACNHSRIQEDIGTVQIPNIFKSRFKNIQIDHNFGREFYENDQLQSYKLIIHCGGCMMSAQKMQARLRDLETVGISYTNYGVFLSWIQGIDSLERVMEPWRNK